jgi:membrane-associated protein
MDRSPLLQAGDVAAREGGANERIKQALAIMDSSAPLLIVGGRYVPGMRFVVNATMGLSDIP